MKQKLAGEFFGTFILVFAGTGAVVVNAVSGGAVTHPGIALTFGLVVLAMVYCFGDISGAHINPAVSLGFWTAGRMPASQMLLYWAAQAAGATAASLLLRAMFQDEGRLGMTLPSGAPWVSLVFEVVMTWILMVVVINVSTGAKEKGITAGIAVGSVIAFEALFGGPISGASMNPARSLGPALALGDFQHFWIYLAGPFLGALAGVGTCRLLHARGEPCHNTPQL